MNPLYQMMGNSNLGNMSGLVQQFLKFRQSFQGNPQQQVQELLNSGKITQQQYDQAVQQAKALQQMLNLK